MPAIVPTIISSRSCHHERRENCGRSVDVNTPTRPLLGDLEPYVPAPECRHRRFYTNARCEMPPKHEGNHNGRDSAGRWHSWPRGERELDNPVAVGGGCND